MAFCTVPQIRVYKSEVYDDTKDITTYATAATLEDDLNYIRSVLKKVSTVIGGGTGWTDVPTALPVATTSTNGVMSATDKSKLDGIATGAQVNPTAAELLTSIETVDGASSGLDADLLDGQQGTYYLDYTNFTNTPTAAALLASIETVDGIGSGLDADLIKGMPLYAIAVAADGTILSGPSGWTVTHSATGTYTITHNLGAAINNTAATVTTQGHHRHPHANPADTNNLIVYIDDDSGVGADDKFFVHLLVIV